MRKAFIETVIERARVDERVYLLGEDIGAYGGAFKVTQGLSDAFPDRVLTTPISEASLFGVAAGMALRGRRPILEIMFGDFIALGFDQIVNGIAKFREMYDDQVTVPLVVLSIGALLGGYVAVPGAWNLVDQWLQPVFSRYPGGILPAAAAAPARAPRASRPARSGSRPRTRGARRGGGSRARWPRSRSRRGRSRGWR